MHVAVRPSVRHIAAIHPSPSVWGCWNQPNPTWGSACRVQGCRAEGAECLAARTRVSLCYAGGMLGLGCFGFLV